MLTLAWFKLTLCGGFTTSHVGWRDGWLSDWLCGAEGQIKAKNHQVSLRPSLAGCATQTEVRYYKRSRILYQSGSSFGSTLNLFRAPVPGRGGVQNGWADHASLNSTLSQRVRTSIIIISRAKTSHVLIISPPQQDVLYTSAQPAGLLRQPPPAKLSTAVSMCVANMSKCLQEFKIRSTIRLLLTLEFIFGVSPVS